MARLDSIKYTPHLSSVENGVVIWKAHSLSRELDNLPHIFWKEGTPWREANLWALERATCDGINLLTVQAEAASMAAYAKWLEKNSVSWTDFPARKADRCLVRYRGALIKAKDAGEIAPSTAKQRMRVVIRFYRWLRNVGFLSPSWPMWNEHLVTVRITDPVGFERTISISSTDLHIKNRKLSTSRLEDGLLPVSEIDREALLSFVNEHASEELFLMLFLGFFTGMRLGCIADLKVRTLENAVPDPTVAGLFKIAVGPGADPPVKTKFGVTGQIWITAPHLEQLRIYSHSSRRLKREVKAASENKDLVFLTRFGNPYAQRGGDKSVALNVEMHALRKKATTSGLLVAKDFHFHQSRCTFATALARLAIQAGGAIGALAIVGEALLHKHEGTTLEYIKFIEQIPMKEAAANEFTRAFLGLVSRQIDQ